MCIFAFDLTMAKSPTHEKKPLQGLLHCNVCSAFELSNRGAEFSEFCRLLKPVLASIDTLSMLATFIWTMGMHVCTL